jgi:hypothetical protein
MSSDYRGFQDKISSDMASASASAASMEGHSGTKGTKVRLRHSDMEPLIPAGSAVEFMPAACHKLKFGDIVFVRHEKEFVLRRFVGFQVGKKGAVIAVARPNPPALEQYPDLALVGRVCSVEVRGQRYDPHKKESLGTRFRNNWTCFGTSTPLKRLAHTLKIFGKMMKK